MERLLLQELTFNGNKIDLSLLFECTFAESIRLDSPRMKLVFSDFFGAFAQEYGIKKGAECTAVLSDSQTTVKLDFTVLILDTEVRRKNNCYVLSLIDSRVFKMMKPLNLPFSGTPKKVLGDILNQLSITSPVASNSSTKGTWHNLKAHISDTIRLIAKETGTLIFFNRDKLICNSFETLEQAEKLIFLDNDLQKGKYPILQSRIINNNHVVDARKRALIGLSEEKGIITTHQKKNDLIPLLTSLTKPNDLQNAQIYYPNIIEVTTDLTFDVFPGASLGFEFKRFGEARAIDETRPTKALAANIIHWTDNKRAVTKIMGCEKKSW